MAFTGAWVVEFFFVHLLYYTSVELTLSYIFSLRNTNFCLQVEGNVFVVYNLGTNDHPLGDISIKVNDNKYHVIKFTRTGANSSLQIDDYNVQTSHPSGIVY